MDDIANRGPSQGTVARPRLLESLRAAIGARHYSRRTEQAYRSRQASGQKADRPYRRGSTQAGCEPARTEVVDGESALRCRPAVARMPEPAGQGCRFRLRADPCARRQGRHYVYENYLIRGVKEAVRTEGEMLESQYPCGFQGDARSRRQVISRHAGGSV